MFFPHLFVSLQAIMAIKKINNEPKLSAFPEEVDENGLKIYGETSYENQIAALSHYLHTTDFEGTQIEVQERRNELMALILPTFSMNILLLLKFDVYLHRQKVMRYV